MEIKISIQNGRVPVTVVHLAGNLDSNEYPAFQSKADELIKGGTRFMLVE
jgi:anti-anti-sigma regulatory factor